MNVLITSCNYELLQQLATLQKMHKMMTPNAEFEYDLYDYKFCVKVNVLYVKASNTILDTTALKVTIVRKWKCVVSPVFLLIYRLL